MYMLFFMFIIMAFVGGICLYNNIKIFGILNAQNITFLGITIIAIIFGIYTYRAHKHIDDIQSVSDVSAISALIISISTLIIALFAFVLQFSSYNESVNKGKNEMNDTKETIESMYGEKHFVSLSDGINGSSFDAKRREKL